VKESFCQQLHERGLAWKRLAERLARAAARPASPRQHPAPPGPGPIARDRTELVKGDRRG
jgi:hypothetical protein